MNKIDVSAIAKALDHDSVHKTDAHFLIDEVIEGAPLVICFAFFTPGAVPQFDFYERMKRIQQLSGIKVNLVLVRDLKQLWYQKGVPGLGDNIVEVTGALMDIIGQIKPSSIMTIGQSMGGYASLTFGALLGVDKIISFGPVSFLDVERALEIEDIRWADAMLTLAKDPPQPFVNDLVEILKIPAELPETHIIYGMLNDDGTSPSADDYHAKRLHISDKITLHPIHDGKHAVVHHLKEKKLINGMLIKMMFGLEMPDLPADPIPEDWFRWMKGGLEAGMSVEEVRRIMLENKFQQPEVDDAIKTLTE